MKRKPIFLALALLLVVGAALWGLNYWLNHPPLTQADKEFRALVADADNVEVSQWSCQARRPCVAAHTITYKPLDAAQTRELIENLRLVDKKKNLTPFAPGSIINLDLVFRHQDKTLFVGTLLQTSRESALFFAASSPQVYPRLHPRFDKRLRRLLDAYLPQRIRP